VGGYYRQPEGGDKRKKKTKIVGLVIGGSIRQDLKSRRRSTAKGDHRRGIFTTQQLWEQKEELKGDTFAGSERYYPKSNGETENGEGKEEIEGEGGSSESFHGGTAGGVFTVPCSETLKHLARDRGKP